MRSMHWYHVVYNCEQIGTSSMGAHKHSPLNAPQVSMDDRVKRAWCREKCPKIDQLNYCMLFVDFSCMTSEWHKSHATSSNVVKLQWSNFREITWWNLTIVTYPGKINTSHTQCQSRKYHWMHQALTDQYRIKQNNCFWMSDCSGNMITTIKTTLNGKTCNETMAYMSLLMTKPTKWHVLPASAQSGQSLRCALNG